MFIQTFGVGRKRKGDGGLRTILLQREFKLFQKYASPISKNVLPMMKHASPRTKNESPMMKKVSPMRKITSPRKNKMSPMTAKVSPVTNKVDQQIVAHDEQVSPNFALSKRRG